MQNKSLFLAHLQVMVSAMQNEGIGQPESVEQLVGSFNRTVGVNSDRAKDAFLSLGEGLQTHVSSNIGIFGNAKVMQPFKKFLSVSLDVAEEAKDTSVTTLYLNLAKFVMSMDETQVKKGDAAEVATTV